MTKSATDRLDAELPQSIDFLIRVRRGADGAELPERIAAARFLIEHAPVFMRVVAEIEREKIAPPTATEAPKAYVRTSYKAPNQPVQADEVVR